MKISDIEKLKAFGNYKCHVSLNNLGRTIETFILEDGLVLNPDFQRGHVWNDSQRSKFVEFILKGGKTTPIKNMLRTPVF